jgi:hypothetical protein
VVDFNTLRHKLLERRVLSLVELGSQTAKVRSLHNYCELALHTMTLNDKDVPFALLYTAENQNVSDVDSVSSPGSTRWMEEYLLKGTIGVDAHHALAPPTFSLQQGEYVLQPFLVQAIKSRKATLVHLDELGVYRKLIGKAFTERGMVILAGQSSSAHCRPLRMSRSRAF